MSQSNEPFKNFVNNHKFTFVASLASILGFILTFTVFFPPQKRPFYSVKSFNLINNSSSTIENLDIKYKLCNNNREKNECQLKAIESLTITRILFWNGGRKKIDKTDIDDNPITIVALENNSILEAKVIHSSNDKTDFRLNPENNTIHFDFLDSSNGGVIEVLHTGLSDEDIALDAYIEDSRFNGKVKRKKLLVSRLEYFFIYLYIFSFISCAFILILVGSMLPKIGLRKTTFDQVHARLLLILMITLLPIFSPLFTILFHSELLVSSKLSLRYPSDSYEVFNSEITK